MTRSSRRILRAAFLLALAGAACGCAANRVKPWDRDLLSEQAMRLGPCPMMSAVDQHIYFSKEGSMGGAELGGGGCGCN